MKIRNLLSITALTLIAGVAFAGLVQPAAVVVDVDNGTAQGDQWTARISKNDVEFIGCGIRLFDTGMGSFEFGFCQAKCVFYPMVFNKIGKQWRDEEAVCWWLADSE